MVLDLTLICRWKLLSTKVSMLSFGLLTELGNGSVHLSGDPSFGVEFLDLSGWNGLVGLASGAIHGLDPQDAILFVVTGKDHSVSFLHCVEERSASIQAWHSNTYTHLYMS